MVKFFAHKYTFPGSDEPDYIKRTLTAFFGLVQGRPGDIFVGLCVLAVIVALLRKHYKTAVGFIVLMCGVVLVRISISILFGGADFSQR